MNSIEKQVLENFELRPRNEELNTAAAILVMARAINRVAEAIENLRTEIQLLKE